MSKKWTKEDEEKTLVWIITIIAIPTLIGFLYIVW